MDKTYKQISEESNEKAKKIKAFQLKIENLKDWQSIQRRMLDQINREKELKSKAPLSLEPKFEFEKLPEWAEHMKESHVIALTREELAIKADLFDIGNQIEANEKLLKEAESE